MLCRCSERVALRLQAGCGFGMRQPFLALLCLQRRHLAAQCVGLLVGLGTRLTPLFHFKQGAALGRCNPLVGLRHTASRTLASSEL